MEIEGKKAVVVGGASGFGRATAESLAKRGASVAVLDRPQSKGREVADAIGGTFHHLVAFLEGLRYSPQSATLVVSIVLGMAAVGKAAMGALGDRIGGKNALAIGFVMIAGGVVILLNAGRAAMLVLWLIVVGIAGAAPVALVPMVTAETFGLKRFGTLFGWLGTVVTVGLFIGPLLVGWLTDVTGSYTTPFEVCALIALLGATAAFLCVVPHAIAIPLVAKAASTSTSPA